MDSLAVPTYVVVWRSTTVDSGGLCVIPPGLQQTLVWLVVNLHFLLSEPDGPQVMLEGEGLYSTQNTGLLWAILSHKEGNICETFLQNALSIPFVNFIYVISWPSHIM